MRLLTFQIEGHMLAIPAESVAAVGKPYRKEKVHQVDIHSALGAALPHLSGQPMITCRHRKRLLEFPVDRVLNLEDYIAGQLRPWPSVLQANRLFKGVVDLEGSLFFLLDLEALGGGRQRTGK